MFPEFFAASYLYCYDAFFVAKKAQLAAVFFRYAAKTSIRVICISIEKAYIIFYQLFGKSIYFEMITLRLISFSSFKLI